MLTKFNKTNLMHKRQHAKATYTAGEGFLTLCARFLTNLIARNSGGDDFSTIRSRPRALLAEGNVLVLKSSPEDVLGALGREP